LHILLREFSTMLRLISHTVAAEQGASAPIFR
jgi:hypothetical protein